MMDRRAWLKAACLIPFCLRRPKKEPTRADMPPKDWKMEWVGDCGKNHWAIFLSPDGKRVRWYKNGKFDEEMPVKRR